MRVSEGNETDTIDENDAGVASVAASEDLVGSGKDVLLLWDEGQEEGRTVGMGIPSSLSSAWGGGGEAEIHTPWRASMRASEKTLTM